VFMEAMAAALVPCSAAPPALPAAPSA
jgi:hypothetical protein